MSNELDKLGKKMPFTVPDGFFETMPQRIGEAIDRENRRKRTGNIVKWTVSTAAAAAIIAIAFLAMKPTAAPVMDTGNGTLAATNTAAATTEAALGDDTALTTQDVKSDSTELYMSNEQLDEWLALAECDEFMNCVDNYDFYN